MTAKWLAGKTAEEIAEAFWVRRGWCWARIGEIKKANLVRDIEDILKEGKMRSERA